MMKHVLLYWTAYLAVLSSVSAQAPGDHSSFCRTGTFQNAHDFPSEVIVLLDNFDYLSLFRNPTFGDPWISSDEDGDGNNWVQNVGGTCVWSPRVCSRQATQDNWLFSQHVRYVDANEVLFFVSYLFSECVSPCTRDYVTLYGYQSDTMTSQRTNPSNYQPLFGDAVSSRLQQPLGESQQVSETLRLTRPANSNGFYLGVRDEGTCGQVDRIIAHYLVCPSRVDGLVSYPETAVPAQNFPDIIFDAVCTPNSDNTTTLQVRASNAGTTSRCTPLAAGGAVCRCNAGYELSGDGLSCPGMHYNLKRGVT